MKRETELICKAQSCVEQLLGRNASNKEIRLALEAALDEDDVDQDKLDRWKVAALERLDYQREMVKAAFAHKLTIPGFPAIILWILVPLNFALQFVASETRFPSTPVKAVIALLVLTVLGGLAYRVRWVHFRDLSMAGQLERIEERGKEWRTAVSIFIGALTMLGSLVCSLYMTNPDIAKFAEFREKQGFENEARRVVDAYLLSFYEATPADNKRVGYIGILGRFYDVHL